MLTKKQLKQAIVNESSDIRTAMISIKLTGLSIAVIVNNHNIVIGVY